MIGQLLLPLMLSTLAIAIPHEADFDEISPGEMLPQRAVLRDLLPRQDTCGYGQKCGTGCMPIVGNCCAPEGDYYCSIGKYCTRGGCCQIGRTCTGSATTTHTSTIYGSRTGLPTPTYTTPGDSDGSFTSSEVPLPPRITSSPSPSESASIPSRTASASDTEETSSEEPSSSSAMPTPTVEPSSQPSASEVPPQVTTNAANPNGAMGMGQLMGVAGLAIGFLGGI